MDGI
jgi:hypothetical protein